MAKKDPVEEALSKLSQLRGQPPSAAAHDQLTNALQSKTNLIVARAAPIAANMKYAELTPRLESAFDRFMANPSTTDKQCAAKVAIVNALNELEAKAEAVFLAGVRHVQWEPVWGGQEDTAIDLRGRCAMSLVNMAYRDVLTILADLLADRAPAARSAASRAIAATQRDEGVLLLRLKILLGDPAPEVTADCILALMSIAPRKSLEFVERFIDEDDEQISQSAALAIGQSRLPEGLALLRRRYEKTVDAERTKYLLPIAMTRLPESLDFLFQEAAERPKLLKDILEAMAIYRHDSSVVLRLREIITKRSDATLQNLLEKLFAA